jgi:ATP-binding cassette subfamily F protein 3
MQSANFLLMDEPTNHLDIASREILTDALEAYRGSLCFITHDRTLIHQIANKIIEVRDGNLHVITGSYADYLNWKESPGSEASAASLSSATGKSTTNNRPRQRKLTGGKLRSEYYRESAPAKKRIAEIETKLAELEAQFREVEGLFSDEEHYGSSERVVATIEKHRRLKGAISSLTEEWERLSLELEGMKQEFEKAKSAAKA